eukprot:6546513-Prymnesium_polylepis.3
MSASAALYLVWISSTNAWRARWRRWLSLILAPSSSSLSSDSATRRSYFPAFICEQGCRI